MPLPARARRNSSAALAERPFLVFDFHGRPVPKGARPPAVVYQPPQSIREAVLAWLDEQL